MKFEKTDVLLFSIAHGLIGFLLGSVLAETQITVSDISSTMIAIAAIYGVLKWREQHDYQQELLDKKEIIKLIKHSVNFSTQLRIRQLALARNLESYVKNKNHEEERKFNTKMANRSLKKVQEAQDRLDEIAVKIESEIAMNSLTSKNEELQFHIHCLVKRINDSIITSDANTSVYENFELIDQTEDAAFPDITESAISDFENFALELGKTECLLGIENSSLAKGSSYKFLKTVDAKKEPESITE